MTITKGKKMETLAMKRDSYEMIINGERVASSTGKISPTYNPATGDIIAQVAEADTQDADRAVEAARNAFDNGKWKRTPVGKRSRVLNKIASIMRERLDALIEIEVMNSGKPVGAAQVQVMQSIEDSEFYAGAIVGHRGTVNKVPGQFMNYTQNATV